MNENPILTLYAALTFEGRPINAFEFQGRRCVQARELGSALGYSHDGKRFTGQVTGRWADDFTEGLDYALIENEALADIKELGTTAVPSDNEREDIGKSPSGAPSISAHARAILVLYESGVHKALLRTTKPAGVALRELLAREVMPQLTRTGEFTPNRQVNEAGDVVDRRTGATVHAAEAPCCAPLPSVTAQREARLLRRQDLLERERAATAQKEVASLLENLGRPIEEVALYRLKAASAITGESYEHLLLPLAPPKSKPGTALVPSSAPAQIAPKKEVEPEPEKPAPPPAPEPEKPKPAPVQVVEVVPAPPPPPPAPEPAPVRQVQVEFVAAPMQVQLVQARAPRLPRRCGSAGSRRQATPIEDLPHSAKIIAWVAKHPTQPNPHFKMEEILRDLFDIPKPKQKKRHYLLIAEVLRRIGMESAVVWAGTPGKATRMWRMKDCAIPREWSF